jgi:eukaryotic-like serine/threonine-protein kinase
MALETRSNEVFRFGTFEVDVRAGELRKQGVRLKLQEQPLRVLTILLQRPGEVVTREELRSQNWPADTFVDFDNSLNTSINKLREALGDSAESPRFIETLPRRGYRFIAPVTSDGPGSTIGSTGVAAAKPTRNWKAISLLAIIVGTGVVAGGMFWRSRQNRKLTDQDTIVLADFTNTTGDPVIDDALKQGLRVQLEQSPFLNILSEKRVSDELRFMGRPEDKRLTAETAREVCQRGSSKALLAGSISKLGSHYVIGLNALNCQSGESLASEQVEVDSREHVLKGLGQLATRIREKLGESLASIHRYDTPLEEATTPSLEALQAYSLGVEATRTMRANPLPFFQRAVQLDPNFAIAYATMGAYTPRDKTALRTEYLRKAYELREKISDWERFYIESHYYDRVLGDLQKAEDVYELWQRVYPRDDTVYTNLAVINNFYGRYEKALEQAREAVRLYPEDMGNKIGVGIELIFLEHLDEAEAVFKQVAERNPDTQLLRERYFLAFLKNDAAGMKVLAKAADPDDAHFLATQGTVEAYYGRLRRARELFLRSVEFAKRNDTLELAASYQAALAMVEAYFGKQQEALADARAAIRLDPSFTISVRAIVVDPLLPMAMAGDVAGAEKLAAKLKARFPRNTTVQRFYLPTFRASAALQRKNPEEALPQLQGLSTPAQAAVVGMQPAYLCGQAHLMLHDGSTAATEFQGIIDHRGLAFVNRPPMLPVNVLARLGLARAYALQGDTVKSRAAYQDFLSLWKDADPDIPVFIAAKSEYAKLQ